MKYALMLIGFLIVTSGSGAAPRKACHGDPLGTAFWIVLSQHDKACARAVGRDLKAKKPGNAWYGAFQRVKPIDRHKLLKLLGDISKGRSLQNSVVSDMEALLLRYFPRPTDLGQVHKSLADTPLQKKMLTQVEKNVQAQQVKPKKTRRAQNFLGSNTSSLQMPKKNRGFGSRTS